MAEKSSKLFADETTGCENTEIIRLVRQTPPSHCALKIESFLSVQETFARNKNDKFESTEFSVGGYTWILSIYLKGKSEENGEGHISFYVRLVDKLDAGNFVYAILRFFLYDQIQDKYLIIQDLKEKRFHTLKTEWGISKALEVSTFEDTSNGFLMNDCCIFGADVLVLRGDYKPTGLLLVDPQTIRTYTWRVTQFNESVTSPSFIIDDRKWDLDLWPKGYGSEKGKHLSIRLFLYGASEFTGGRKLYVDYDLIVKNQLKEDDHKKTFGHWFSDAHSGWVISLLPLTDVDNPSKGFKVNDVIVIEVKINEIFILKDV